MGIRLLALLGTISCLVLLLSQTEIALGQGADGTVTASFSVVEPLVVVDTTITPSQGELITLEATLESLTAADLQLTGEPLEIVPSVLPDSTLTVALPLTGATEGPIAGEINFTLDNLQVQAVAGETTTSIQFDSALTVVGTASLVGTADGGIDLNISDPQLLLQPLDPDVSLLPGGDPTVTEIGASFAVDLNSLPDGAALDVTFAKDTSTLLSEPGSKFLLLADSVDGQLGDLSNDVAFGIKVVKIGIGDADLGDTEATLEASKAWFDSKIAEGKRILIAKFNDAGDPVPPPQDVTNTCTATTDPVVCTVILTGAQGGLSVFALAAITVPNNPPVATAAFIPIDVNQSEGTFSIVATGSDPDGDPTTVVAVLTTPSPLGLKLALKNSDSIKVKFDLKEGNLKIESPDPQATLDALQQLSGFQVQDGQTLDIEIEDKQKVELELEANETLEIEAPEVILQVTATDLFGASNTVTASPVFAPEDIDTDALGASTTATTSHISEPVEESALQPAATSRVVFSQRTVRIIADTETRLRTPDGQVELIVPADFLPEEVVGKIVELVLKNLDPVTVPSPEENVQFIRAIEVNGLVEGQDGSLKNGGPVVLVIPPNSQDIATASGDPSKLEVLRLDFDTGAWEPLPATLDYSAASPRLKVTLEKFSQSTIGIFQPIPSQTRSDSPQTLGAVGGTASDSVPVPGSQNGWSERAIIGVSAGAIVILLALLISVVVIRRRAS